jgi:hypothetical protein
VENRHHGGQRADGAHDHDDEEQQIEVPFLAVNTHLREEHNFGGDLTVQAGWLRRGVVGQTLRFGGHYFNGKSSQFQFFDNWEEQMGLGLWYDF